MLASELDDIRSALEVNLGLGLGLVLAFQLGRTALEVNQRRGTWIYIIIFLPSMSVLFPDPVLQVG